MKKDRQRLTGSTTAGCLKQLGLSADEIDALTHQGFVQCERRGGGREYFKLRFRWQGRQRVCCLGTDRGIAKTIKNELIVLQRVHQLCRKAIRLAERGRRLLRSVKVETSQPLAAAGFKYHGLEIRRIIRSDCF
jgi:hypothetical protein